MHYSNDPAKVRGDFFKPSGKWYKTIEIDMSDQWNTDLIQDAIWNSLDDQNKKTNAEMDLVVLAPYHKNSHPVQLKAS